MENEPNNAKRRATAKRDETKYHLRSKDSWIYKDTATPEDFMLFFDDSIWSDLKSLHGGYNVQQKKNLAVQCCNQLIKTGLPVTSDVIPAGTHQLKIYETILPTAGVCVGASGKNTTAMYSSWAPTIADAQGVVSHLKFNLSAIAPSAGFKTSLYCRVGR